MQSLQLYQVQHQAVLVVEQGGTAVGPSLPPVPPPLRHVYNVAASTSPQLQQCYYLEMIGGKVSQDAKF